MKSESYQNSRSDFLKVITLQNESNITYQNDFTLRPEFVEQIVKKDRLGGLNKEGMVSFSDHGQVE